MAGITGGYNRFSALNRPNFNGSFGGGSTIGGGNFSGNVPRGFGGVGSFGNSGFGNFGGNSFNNFGTSFGGSGFNNSFSSPYNNSFGGGFNSYGGGFNSFGGGGSPWTQLIFAAAFAIPQIIQGLQGLFQGIRERRQGAEDSDQCCEVNNACDRSGHPDMSAHESYIDGQEGHRIDETGVNMSFEMDY